MTEVKRNSANPDIEEYTKIHQQRGQHCEADSGQFTPVIIEAEHGIQGKVVELV